MSSTAPPAPLAVRRIVYAATNLYAGVTQATIHGFQKLGTVVRQPLYRAAALRIGLLNLVVYIIAVTVSMRVLVPAMVKFTGEGASSVDEALVDGGTGVFEGSFTHKLKSLISFVILMGWEVLSVIPTYVLTDVLVQQFKDIQSGVAKPQGKKKSPREIIGEMIQIVLDSSQRFIFASSLLIIGTMLELFIRPRWLGLVLAVACGAWRDSFFFGAYKLPATTPMAKLLRKMAVVTEKHPFYFLGLGLPYSLAVRVLPEPFTGIVSHLMYPAFALVGYLAEEPQKITEDGDEDEENVTLPVWAAGERMATFFDQKVGSTVRQRVLPKAD